MKRNAKRLTITQQDTSRGHRSMSASCPVALAGSRVACRWAGKDAIYATLGGLLSWVDDRGVRHSTVELLLVVYIQNNLGSRQISKVFRPSEALRKEVVRFDLGLGFHPGRYTLYECSLQDLEE